MPRVQLPDGRVVDVPDDATPEQLSAFKAKLAAEFPDAAPQKTNTAPQKTNTAPQKARGLSSTQREKARSIGEQFVNADTKNPIKAFTGSLKASTLGAGGGAFEAANALLRRQIMAQMGVDKDTAKELADEVLGGAASARPGAFGTGFAVGALGSGGAAVKGASAIPKIGKALQLRRGQTLANIARTSAGGAAGGGLAAAGAGDDVGTGTAVGAVAGPLVGAAVRGGGAVVNRLKNKSEQGFEMLARALQREGRKIKPHQLKQEFARKREELRRNPTLVEILGERGSQDVLGVAQGSDRAKDTLVEAGKRQAKALQDNLAANITEGRAVTGPGRLKARRGAAMDAAMKRIGGTKLTLDDDEVNVLLDEAYVGKIPPVLRRKLMQGRDEGGVRVSIREMDDLRQSFRDAIKKGESVRVFGDIADEVTERAAKAEPRYGAALGSFKRRSQGAEGVKLGQGILSAPTTEFVQAAETAIAPTVGGARVGARTALADEAQKGPKQAAGLVSDLADQSGLSTRLRALDPEEAARLQNIASAEREALKSGGASVRGIQQKSASEEDLDSARRATEAVIVALGRGSGAFQANLFMRGLQRLRVPPVAAQKLTEAATDPARTEEVIQILSEMGIKPRQVEELARAASNVGGRSAAASAE